MKLQRMTRAMTFAAALVTAGCHYNYAPVLVEVRDRASHEPVAGAEVHINNTRTLNPDPPQSAVGATGPNGDVILMVGLYNDLVIRVTPPGGAAHVFSTEHPALVGPGPWMRPIRTVGAGAPIVEIRLAPSSQLPEASETEPATAPKSPAS